MPTTPNTTPSLTRALSVFALQAYGRICARKHSMAVPPEVLASVENLSDEELERWVQMLRELSHLPPA